MMLKYFQDQAQAATRRYLSEGELLSEPGQNMLGGGSMVGPSSSAGHIQDLAGSPQRQLYYGHSQPGPQPTSDPASPLHSHSYAQQVRDILSSHWSGERQILSSHWSGPFNDIIYIAQQTLKI